MFRYFFFLYGNPFLCCVDTVKKRIFSSCPFLYSRADVEKSKKNFSKSCRNRASRSVKYSRGSFILRAYGGTRIKRSDHGGYAKWNKKTQSAAENDWVNDSKLLRKWFADRIAWLDKEWA